MEYAEKGDLEKMINDHKKKKQFLKESVIWDTFTQIVCGLNELHKHNILHRDLKAANIFLTAKRVKLGDLNVAKETVNGLLFTQTGTPFYASPEVWQDKPYDSKSDIWSLGVLLF